MEITHLGYYMSLVRWILASALLLCGLMMDCQTIHLNWRWLQGEHVPSGVPALPAIFYLAACVLADMTISARLLSFLLLLIFHILSQGTFGILKYVLQYIRREPR